MLYISPILITVPLLTAAYFDYCERRIPNAVTLPLLFGGLALQGIYFGIDGLMNSFLGAAVGGGLFLLLYFFNAMGAGDVKLGAAVGCWLGIRFAAVALFYTILIGGLMAIIQLFFKRRRINSMKTESIDVKTSDETSIFEGKCKPNAETLPYGIAISGGVFALFLKILWETRP